MKAYRGLLGCLLAAFLYVLPTSASAQCSGIFNAGDVCGNSTAAGTLAKNASITTMFDRAFCGTNNSTVIRLAGTWVCLGLGTNVPAFLTTPSSANLAAAVTDETGSGSLVFATAPTFVTPRLLGSSTGFTTFASANSGASNFTLTFPGATDTLAALAQTQSWSGANTFANNGGIRVLGSSTGVTFFASANAGASNFTLTFPAATDTVAVLGQTQIWTGANTFPNSGGLRVQGASTGVNLLATANASVSNFTTTLPAATDTLVGKATTDTLTNKTFDTAGAGNSFSINGVAATANTGTGAVARATSPVFVTPTLGAASATTLNGNTFTTGTYTLSGVAAKTLTFNNSLTLAGTDATTITFQGTDTYVGRATTDTLTNKSISGSTNTLSNLALSSMATQAAFTFVGNNTSGVAAPTAVSIPGLTTKASPVSGDLVMIADSAASNAWKQTTVGALASAGSVASFNGLTGAVTSNVVQQTFCPSGCSTTVAGGGNQAYTPTTNTTATISECVGGGAGGGGAAGAVAGNQGAGAGGGAGASGRSILSAATMATGVTIFLGAKGTGGATGNNAGNTGGQTYIRSTAAITVTIASPGVFTWTTHGLYVGQPIAFQTSGALPTGITANTTYYVIAAGLTANAFEVAATIGGAAIITTGTQSGTHTAILLACPGGNGGTGAAAASGSTGGTGGTAFATTAIGVGMTGTGGLGGSAFVSVGFPAGNGASSHFGGGGIGAQITGSGAFNGTNATGWGAGGSGGASYNSSSTAAGGDGKEGWLGMLDIVN